MAEKEGEIREFNGENLFGPINRGEKTIHDVDWVTWLRNIQQMLNNKEKSLVTWVAMAWGFANELVDYTRRVDMLGLWQTIAPQCFDKEDEREEFIASCDAVIQYNLRLRGLVLLQGAKVPHTYDHVGIGGRGLNELALVWSNQYITGADLVMLAEEIYQAGQHEEKEPMIEQFLLCYRNADQLSIEDISTFSRHLYLAECFRQYLVEGKMYTDAPMTFGDFKRKLRNASFEEYIRIRVEQIRVELDEDNWQLLDPTDDDCYRQLYEDEESVANREFGFEQFRGSIAYSQQWYDGRPEVLNMIKYFMDYLNWKMEHLHEDTMSKNQPTQVIHGDYIAGNKYTGTVIGTVAAGGIGVQVNHGKQEKPADIPTEPKTEESKPQEQPQAEEIELTDGAIDLHLQLFKAAMLKVQDVKYSEIKFATAIMNTYEWYAVLRLGLDIGLLDGYTDLITLMKEGDFKHKPTNPQNVNPYKKHINAEPLYPNWQCAHRASEPYFRKFKFIADNTYSIYKLGCKEHHIRPFGSDK